MLGSSAHAQCHSNAIKRVRFRSDRRHPDPFGRHPVGARWVHTIVPYRDPFALRAVDRAIVMIRREAILCLQILVVEVDVLNSVADVDGLHACFLLRASPGRIQAEPPCRRDGGFFALSSVDCIGWHWTVLRLGFLVVPQ